ncbi:hypothetical protein HPB49_008160 [Dermacentor silvarum]|uniref:Uncharacterized protein n=1 Tax=Dermacentor silvarum TaxID=543639 RepID=A0ACB8D3Y5_DERSI|nr:hypothetical protein HPB49_008160 [Dermacentor silvarum]
MARQSSVGNIGSPHVINIASTAARRSGIVHHHHAVRRIWDGGSSPPPFVHGLGRIVTLATKEAHMSTQATESGETPPPVPAAMPLYGRRKPFEGDRSAWSLYEEQVLHFTDAFLARNMTTTKMSVSDLPPMLTHLSLRSCFFHPAEFFRAEFGRPALRSLQLLDLADCNLVSSVELGRLEQWPSLRALSLEGCHRVNDGGLSNILPLISNLVALDIEGTDISDRGVEMILLHGPNLRFLFLGHTSCTGEVFVSVSRQLKGRRKLGLSHICLRRTLVKDEPLYRLLEMVPHLTWLAVTSRHMSADVRARVKEAVPSSCQFVQFLPFYVNASTFCRHFVSDSIQNLKLDMMPCDGRTVPG